MKTLKGWRTIIFNAATLAIAVADVLPPKAALITAAIGNMVLRAITTTPMTRSE